MAKKPKLLLLDRDGVINHDSANYIRSLQQWQPIDGSLEAIARASQAGWLVAVVTNQSGLARGYFSRQTLEQIHRELRQRVEALGGAIAAIAYCPHGPNNDGSAGCDCRKPQPGLVADVLNRLSVSPAAAIMVGDSLRDLQAAQAAGVRPALVLTGNGEKTAVASALPKGTAVYPDLASAVDALMAAQA